MIDYYHSLSLAPELSCSDIRRKLRNLKLECEQSIAAEESVGENERKLALISQAEDTLLEPDTRDSYDQDLLNCDTLDLEEDALDPIDYQLFRSDNNQNWKELVKGKTGLSVYQTLLRLSVKLQNPSIEENVLLAAYLTPSALSTCQPIVLATGESGSGKSQLSGMASLIWGCGEPLSGATPYAAMRRHILALSTMQVGGDEVREINYVLAWDDLDAKLLGRSEVLALLKCGYSRSTSIIKVSKTGSDTETNDFQTFGGKFISSVYEFFADPKFIELNRRMLIFPIKKDPAFRSLNYATINWKGLSNYTNKFWNKHEHMQAFVKAKKEVNKYTKTSTSLTEGQVLLCSDLIATGLTWGIWENVATACQNLEKFFAGNDELISNRIDPLRSILDSLLEKSEIGSKVLKHKIELGYVNGVIGRVPKHDDIARFMAKHDYILNIKKERWEKVN